MKNIFKKTKILNPHLKNLHIELNKLQKAENYLDKERAKLIADKEKIRIKIKKEKEVLRLKK